MRREYGLVSTTLSESTATFCRVALLLDALAGILTSAARDAAAARKVVDMEVMAMRESDISSRDITQDRTKYSTKLKEVYSAGN